MTTPELSNALEAQNSGSNLSEFSLMQNARKIIITSKEIARLEAIRFKSYEQQQQLTEWRRALRLLRTERKKMRQAAQLRLF